jgi:hypothetical protein
MFVYIKCYICDVRSSVLCVRYDMLWINCHIQVVYIYIYIHTYVCVWNLDIRYYICHSMYSIGCTLYITCDNTYINIYIYTWCSLYSIVQAPCLVCGVTCHMLYYICFIYGMLFVYLYIGSYVLDIIYSMLYSIYDMLCMISLSLYIYIRYSILGIVY